MTIGSLIESSLPQEYLPDLVKSFIHWVDRHGRVLDEFDNPKGPQKLAEVILDKNMPVVVLSDVHITNEESARFFVDNIKMILKLYPNVQIIINGDLSDGTTRPSEFMKYLDTNILSNIILVLGNHDRDARFSGVPKARSREYWPSEFRSKFHTCADWLFVSDKDKIPWFICTHGDQLEVNIGIRNDGDRTHNWLVKMFETWINGLFSSHKYVDSALFRVNRKMERSVEWYIRPRVPVLLGHSHISHTSDMIYNSGSFHPRNPHFLVYDNQSSKFYLHYL